MEEKIDFLTSALVDMQDLVKQSGTLEFSCKSKVLGKRKGKQLTADSATTIYKNAVEPARVQSLTKR